MNKSRIKAILVLRPMTPRGFLICALCLTAIVASTWSATANQPGRVAAFDGSSNSSRASEPVPIAIYDTFSVSPTTTPPAGFDRSFVGVFTAIIGTDVVTGASQMDVCLPDVPGGVIRCRFTYVRSDGEGSIVLASVCVISQGHGAWHLETGTGLYRNFKAVGTETFGRLPLGGQFTDFERFAGIGTFDRHGNDDHDEDDHGHN